MAGNYTAQYGTGDITEVVTDGIATTANAGLDFVEIWVIILIVGAIATAGAIAIRKFRRR